MKKHLKLVEIEQYDDKGDGSQNGKTYILHLKVKPDETMEEIVRILEEDYLFDMKSSWRIKEISEVNL